MDGAIEISISLGKTLVELKLYEQAGVVLDETIRVLESLSDETWPDRKVFLTDALNTRGNSYYVAEAFEEALETYAASAAACPQDGRFSASMALALRNKALVLGRLGRRAEQAAALKELLDTELAPEERLDTEYQLATVYDEQGAPQLAQAILERLLPDASSTSAAEILWSLAIVVDRQGMTDEALALFRRASIAAAKLGDARRRYIPGMCSYAVQATLIGDVRLARNVLRRATHWAGPAPPTRDRRLLREVKIALADVEGRAASALRYLKHQEADIVHDLGDGGIEALRTRLQIADILDSSAPEKAYTVLSQALAGYRGERAEPILVFGLTLLARVALRVGRSHESRAAAIDALGGAIGSGSVEAIWLALASLANAVQKLNGAHDGVLFGKIAAEVMRRHQMIGGETHRASHVTYNRTRPVWRDLIQALAAAQRIPEAEAVYRCFRREDILNAIRRTGIESGYSIPVPLTGSEGQACEALYRIMERGRKRVARALTSRTPRPDWERADRRHRRDIAGWVAGSSSLPSQASPPIALPAGTNEDVALGYLLLDDRLIISVSVSDGIHRKEIDLSSALVGTMCYRFREAVISGSAEAETLGSELSEALLAPVWARMRDARHVRISTDGALRYIPFCALPVDGRYLVERVSISYWSGAPARRRASTLPGSWRLVGAGTASLDHVKRELEGLPCGLGKTILFGDEFTSNALSRALSAGAEVVHLASHFDLDPVHAGRSRLRLGDGSSLSLATLREGSDYNFSDVELLYLSGCDTGTAAHGPGTPESLAGVFHLKGVRDVVATLWPILDDDACTVSIGFYGAIASGAAAASSYPMAEALRLAQIGMLVDSRTSRARSGTPRRGLHIELADTKNPQHWASHVLFAS